MTNENFKKNRFTVYFLVAIIFVAFFGVMMTKNKENVNVVESPNQIEEENGENMNNDEEAVFCTMDAKICPDGSAVGRIAPDCEFAPCPGEEDGARDQEVILGNSSLDNAIRQYLLSQEAFSWTTEEGSSNFCHFENLNKDNQLFPYELMVRCGEYKLSNGIVIELSGVSAPIKISYPNELSYYDISQMTHEAPRDGRGYEADIRRIFSEEARINLDGGKSRALDLGLRGQALEHFYTESDWQNVVNAIFQCEVDTAWQAHSREVSVDLKDGSKLYAVEPGIDDIIDIAREASPACGDIRIGTE